MSSSTKVTPDDILVGQKIRKIRKQKNKTQEELATDMYTYPAKLSNVEQGLDKFSEEELNAIRAILGIEGTPLTTDECKSFKEGLYHYYDLLADDKMAQANDFKARICNIVKIDCCDDELPRLYRLFEVMHLFIENDVKTAEERLDYFHGKIDKLSIEHLYYYYYNMGALKFLQNDTKHSLEFYMKSLDIVEADNGFLPRNEKVLYYNIATCYTNTELPNLAIMFLNKVSKINSDEKVTVQSVYIGVILAINYYKIGDFKESESTLNDCLIKAMAVQNDFLINSIYLQLGITNRFAKKWVKSVDYLNKAINNLDANSDQYAWATYYKIRCTIETKSFVKSEELIKQAKSAKINNELHMILLEIINHILCIARNMTSYKEKSADYLEKKAIPYLIDDNERLEAVSCCNLLDKYYIKNRKNGKSKSIKLISSNIYIRILSNRAREDIQ